MRQALSDKLSGNELAAVVQQPWWLGCPATPFLVKFAVCEQGYVVAVSDLCSLWLAKAGERQVCEECKRFNKSLEAKSATDILNVLDKQLSRSPRGQFKRLDFKASGEGRLLFSFEVSLEIYPFRWAFELEAVQGLEVKAFLCKDLLSPLQFALQAVGNRADYYFRRCQLLERGLAETAED